VFYKRLNIKAIRLFCNKRIKNNPHLFLLKSFIFSLQLKLFFKMPPAAGEAATVLSAWTAGGRAPFGQLEIRRGEDLFFNLVPLNKHPPPP
jgi:hypothetical protein